VCTGDYAQFTDRPDLATASESSAATSADSSAKPPAAGNANAQAAETGKPQAAPGSAPVVVRSAAPVLRGFVTARQLEDTAAKLVRLAPDARLTPLARDFARHNGIQVEQVCAEEAGPSGIVGQWLWWTDGQCPAVEALTSELADGLRSVSQPHRPGSLHTAVKHFARQVADGAAVGGVLFVASAARAGCYANRCPGLRAVVGTCGGAVEQGVEQLAANVLIVEYPYHGLGEMRSMVGRFIESPRRHLADVERCLQELSTCA
jgi:hypothetical protein